VIRNETVLAFWDHVPDPEAVDLSHDDTARAIEAALREMMEHGEIRIRVTEEPLIFGAAVIDMLGSVWEKTEHGWRSGFMRGSWDFVRSTGGELWRIR